MSDVPGGAVTVGPGSPGANKFLYAALPAAMKLFANTSYFLLSQETAGGDYWYDYTPVSTTGVAAVNALVYQNASGGYVTPSITGSSYVPVSFTYSLTSPGPNVTITSPVAGSTYTGSAVTYTATAAAAQGLTVTSVQFQVSSGGSFTNYGPALTQAPYTTQENTSSLASGLNTVQAVATDSAGGVTTSSPVSFYVQPASGGSGTLISGFSGTFVRNNYSGFVGLESPSAPLRLP